MGDWLRETILDGLTGLLVLRLRNAPASDTIKKTADIWEQAIGPKVSNEELDAPRIAAGFKRIFPLVREWPAPIQVIELMPLRPRLPALEYSITPEQRRKNKERLRELAKLVDAQ